MRNAELGLTNQAHRRARGVISSAVAPYTATLVRFDFYSDEAGNEAIATKKGSREMQGDGVAMQIGETAARHNT